MKKLNKPSKINLNTFINTITLIFRTITSSMLGNDFIFNRCLLLNCI